MNAQMAAGCCTCVSVLYLALKCSSSNCHAALQVAAKVHLTCGLYVEVCTLVLHTLPLDNSAGTLFSATSTAAPVLWD